MTIISDIVGREVLDSRGHPTVEVEVYLKNGAFGRAMVPSGASTGAHEAVELRDGGKRYHGRGAKKAVSAVNGEILEELRGRDARDQIAIDQAMISLDGTSRKERLGANAILGVSLAVAKAVANSLNLPLYRYIGGVQAHILPVPMMNIINGGVHADNLIDFQEFMIIPVGARTLQEAVQYGSEVFYELKERLQDSGYSTNVGDEGGFAPHIKSTDQAIDFIVESIIACGYKPREEIAIGLDCAATGLYKNGSYFYKGEGKSRSAQEQVEYLSQLVDAYPIIMIEDGMAEDNWDDWKLLTDKIGKKCQLVGDDLFVTNSERLRDGIQRGAANSILVKVNQVGTLSEALDAVETAYKAGYRVVISHRSGETEDAFISDLAVATNCGQIKAGSLTRSDRLAKYNQLIRIEENLGVQARYAGNLWYL